MVETKEPVVAVERVDEGNLEGVRDRGVEDRAVVGVVAVEVATNVAVVIDDVADVRHWRQRAKGWRERRA